MNYIIVNIPGMYNDLLVVLNALFTFLDTIERKKKDEQQSCI